MNDKYLTTTSRNLNPTDYAWESVIHQASRPLLDSELNLSQDILRHKNNLPSGMLSTYPVNEEEGSFVYYSPYVGGQLNPSFQANTLTIKKFKVNVNGMTIEIKGTNSADASLNHVSLPDPEVAPSVNPRTDFVFLEVWRQEVTPSMNANSRLRVQSPIANDTLTFSDNVNQDKVLTAGGNFDIGVSNSETARNIAEKINSFDGPNLGLTLGNVTVTAETKGTDFVFLSMTGGIDGNSPTFNVVSSNVNGFWVLSPPTGGSNGEGKPLASKIYYAGNVDSDNSLWLDDDIQDPNLTVSSSRRVQIQYRLRVHSTFDLSNEIFGLENPILYARGLNANPVNNFTFQRSPTDNGLWYAGTGTEADADTLNTVDGYVYAIPICFVFRRDQPNGNDGFNPLDYFNTGAKHDHAGNLNDNDYVGNVDVQHSDRPDGLFSDQISGVDVLDLRRRVFANGIDFYSELSYQFDSLLDGEIKTWFANANNLQDTGNGSGGLSHTPLICDVFGSNNNTLNIGNHKRNFDHIARRFSSNPVIERVFVRIVPALYNNTNGVNITTDANNTSQGWYEDDVITINLTQLNARGNEYWDPSFNDNTLTDNPSDSYPVGTKVIDTGHCWHNDGHYVNAIDQNVRFKKITGLGTDVITLVLDRNQSIANDGTLNNADYRIVGDSVLGDTDSFNDIFIELIVEYPAGDLGLSSVPVGALYPDSSSFPLGSAITLNEPNFTNANMGIPLEYANIGNETTPPFLNFQEGTREVCLEYLGVEDLSDLISRDGSSVYLPFRVNYYNQLSASHNGVQFPLNLNDCKFSHSESKLEWSNGWVNGQRKMRVQSRPVLPYHATGGTDTSVFVFYRRQAPQTAGADFALATPIHVGGGGKVPRELELKPISVSKEITTHLRSRSSYPFFNPTEQLGTSPLADSSSYNEYLVLNGNEIFLDDLRINTGNITLPVFLPFVTSVDLILGDSVNGVPQKDLMGRVIYPTMLSSTYFPSSFAKNLSAFYRDYKSSIPALMKITTDDHDLYRKGEVVLVVFTKTSIGGQNISVNMRSDNENLVVATVYRTRNLLLLGD